MPRNGGLQGAEKLQKEFDKLARKHVKAEKQAVEMGAKMFAERLERNTPRSYEKGAHLEDDVLYSVPRDDGGVYSTVGYGKDTSFRMHFANFGTINQPPQAFVEKTERESAQRVIAEMEKAIKKELGL